MRRMTHHSMIVKLIPCKLRNFASSFALNWPRNKLQAKFESCCAPSSSAEASSENIEGVPCEQGDTLEVEERELHNVGLERKPKKGEEVELECERLAFKVEWLFLMSGDAILISFLTVSSPREWEFVGYLQALLSFARERSQEKG